MKRVFLLILIAIATFLLFALFNNTDLLNDIWLYLIGLAGLIVQAGKSLLDYFKSIFEKKEEKASNSVTNTNIPQNLAPIPVQPDPSNIHMSILRFHDDGKTTLGLLYINDKFYCYTLEDTYRQIKISGETRIAAGNYRVDYAQIVTDMTQRYRQLFPEWFSYHLEIKNVPDFQGIYIHNGGDHHDTAGCILVSDSFNISKEKKVLTNSKSTFEMMYKFLARQLSEGKKIVLTIKDEGWISQLPQ